MAGNRGLWMIATFVLSVAGVASCGSVVEDPVDGPDRTVAVYESILDWLLIEEPSVVVGEKPDWVLFVGSRSDLEIGLDVQVDVVEAFDSRVFVRFVDERSEAIDVDSENESVQAGGLLVGLGAVAQQGESVEVYVDRYRNVGDIDAWLVTVREAGPAWEIVGSPAPTDVRPLPADD